MGFTPVDIGSYVASVNAIAAGTFTSVASTNLGRTIDRFGFASGRADSCQIVVPWEGQTTAAKTLSVSAYLQDSPEGSTWTDFSSTVQATNAGGYYSVVTTAATTGMSGVYRRDVDITTADRYVRIVVDAHINSVLSTLCTYTGVLTFGGFDEYPATT